MNLYVESVEQYQEIVVKSADVSGVVQKKIN